MWGHCALPPSDCSIEFLFDVSFHGKKLTCSQHALKVEHAAFPFIPGETYRMLMCCWWVCGIDQSEIHMHLRSNKAEKFIDASRNPTNHCFLTPNPNNLWYVVWKMLESRRLLVWCYRWTVAVPTRQQSVVFFLLEFSAVCSSYRQTVSRQDGWIKKLVKFFCPINTTYFPYITGNVTRFCHVIWEMLTCVQCMSQLVTHRLFTKSVHLLSHEQCTKIVFNALEGNYALCLLGQSYWSY